MRRKGHDRAFDEGAYGYGKESQEKKFKKRGKERVMKTMEKREWGYMLCIWGSGIVFLLYFSYLTSPLFPWAYGWDSAFFQLVGAGMKQGYIPYRDFFDMKGPWLFFIEYLGQLIWPDRMGIFLLQCVSLGSVLFLVRRIQRKYFGRAGLIESLITFLPLYIVLSSTIEGGNLTEEWSLPFLFFSLYLSLDFIMEEREEHRPWNGFLYGVCFGILALIRITNTVLICAIVLTITIHLIQNRKWKNLLWNAGAFLAGIAAAFLPPLLYFGVFGEIGSMLYAVFVFGFIYGTEGFAIGTGGLFILALLFTVFVFVLTGQRKKRLWMLVLVNTAGMMITLGMGNSTLHDYILVIPGMMFGLWQLAGTRQDIGAGWKRAFLVAAAFLCFAYPVRRMAADGLSILRQAGDDTEYRYVTESAAVIPEEERGQVWCYECHLRWNLITDIMPYSRYCGWQEHYMQLSPQIEAEIYEMMETAPPVWIVTKASAEIQNEMMREQLGARYEVFTENGGYRLYRLKRG